MPYYKWNKENKSWSIPFAEKYLQEIKLIAVAEKLQIIYEEEVEDKNKKSHISPIDTKNYIPQTEYQFLDQKRKKIVAMKKLIAKFDILTNDLNLQL